jgi:prolipoprotein diacylglyceryltransferase
LPNWFFAYTYPQNVNRDGILIPGNYEEHNRVLPLPVFPTPFYETILCSLIFIFLWGIRNSIKTPFVMFGIYLLINGIERFMIELIRVNKTYSILGFHPSQAEIIALMLSLSGLLLIIIAKKKQST